MSKQEQEERQISIEQAIRAYRQVSTDQTQSWKYDMLPSLSNDSLLECPKEERLEFGKRLDFSITIADNIKAMNGTVCNGRELINNICNSKYANVDKKNKKVVFSTSNGERPVGNKAYLLWNGFQVIDMDIKDREIAEKLKTHIFNDLKRFNWFLGVVFSSSGKGLHIYTKIQVPQSDENNLKKKKLIYFTNFRHKYSFVYISCKKVLSELGKTEDDLLKWMDLSMFRPQQGAFIPFDKEALVSTRFFEDFIYVCFDSVEDMGDPDVDWVSYPPLKKIFKRWEWFEDTDNTPEITVEDAPALTSDGTHQYHYKHNERWKLANTLVQIYGKEQGYKYMRMICTNDTTDKEIQGDCLTASRHNKPIDQWAVTRLNKYHGFKIKTSSDVENDPQISKLYSTIDNIENPLMIKAPKDPQEFYITKDMFLSDIKDKILVHTGQITLIEAGAGVGKTEMVKQIVRDGKKVLLVLPYTSTIKSKIENDKFWQYAYGNRKVDLTRSVAITVDKFAKLSLVELKDAGFDYVFVDESHLLFSSKYRPIMSKAVDNIRHSEVPIIMMSGTPTGELVFFPDLTYIHVIKEDVRKKEFHVIVTEDSNAMFLDMCRSMARDISKGRRILFPTNRGTQRAEQIAATVQYFCENEFHCRYADGGTPVIARYYKKSNTGDTFMDDINQKQTVGNTDILCCSNFLSVGIDINDRYDFCIYFDSCFMPQEIEQFANRLRNHDLIIYLYIYRKDENGNPQPIFQYHDINLRLNEEELKACQAIVKICNGAISRSPVEYKYNSIISSLMYNNNYVQYDDVENKYYLNETAYKLIMFEDKYRDFIQQLPVIIKGMICYGYEYSAEDHKVVLPEGVKADEILSIKKATTDIIRGKNANDTYELINLITDDRLSIYQDARRGRYSYVKGNEWSEDLANKTMVVKNIEVFEKVVPVFLSLYRIFNLDDIRSIFEYCHKKVYNFSAIRRIKTLATILYNEKRNRLDIPIKDYMSDVYNFVSKNEEKGVTKKEIEDFINDFAIKYAVNDSSHEIPILSSTLAMEEIKKSLTDVFKCLVDVGRPRKDNTMTLHKCELLWQEKQDDINMFNDTIARDFILGDLLDGFETKTYDMTADTQELQPVVNTDITNDVFDGCEEEEEEEEHQPQKIPKLLQISDNDGDDLSKYIIDY